MIDIRTLRAAGLTDVQILKVIEEDQAKVRELNRIRKQKQRSRHADGRDGCDVDILTSLPSSIATLEKEERLELVAPAPRPKFKYPAEFEALYQQYPRKDGGKQDAYKAWVKITKAGVSNDDLIAGAMRYAADPNRDPAYTKHCATWLNKGCHSDGLLPQRGGQNGTLRLHTGQPAVNPVQAAADRIRRRLANGESLSDIASLPEAGIFQSGQLHDPGGGKSGPVLEGSYRVCNEPDDRHSNAPPMAAKSR